MAETTPIQTQAAWGELSDDFAPINTWTFDNALCIYSPSEKNVLQFLRDFLIKQGASGPFKVCHVVVYEKSPLSFRKPLVVICEIDGKRYFAAVEAYHPVNCPTFPPSTVAMLSKRVATEPTR